MVGVPRSSGCRSCVEKKLKCDKTRPECKECQRRKKSCPGYPEKFPFCNKHIGNIHESRQRNKYTVSYRPGGAAIPRSSHQPTMTSMDVKVEPNLLKESLHGKHVEIISEFIAANFSCLQACYGSRVDCTWLDLVRAHPSPEFLRLAIRCVATFHVGQAKNQLFDIIGSQCVYQYALSSVQTALGHSDTSYYTFAAVFMLAIYEIKNRLSQESWLSHMNAIAGMMQLYPAKVFSSGFGRTLFLTFRPFLIRAAFAQNQACFLGKEEWVTMVESTICSEYDKKNGSVLGELNERVIIEVAKVPGLVARASSLHTGPNMLPFSESMALLDVVTQCKDRLRELQEQLLHIHKDLHAPILDMTATYRYFGRIPLEVAKKVSQGCLEGIQCTLTLLNSLEHQDAATYALRQSMASGFVNGGSIHGVDIFHHASVVSYGVSPDVGGLDSCAISLGVIPSG